VPLRWARSIVGKAARLVADSRLGPGQNRVRVIERSAVPPAVDRRAFSLRRRADTVECSVADRITTFAEQLADLLARQARWLGLFNWFHSRHPFGVAGNCRLVTGPIKLDLAIA
jgi:hypothetical protein